MLVSPPLHDSADHPMSLFVKGSEPAMIYISISGTAPGRHATHHVASLYAHSLSHSVNLSLSDSLTHSLMTDHSASHAASSPPGGAMARLNGQVDKNPYALERDHRPLSATQTDLGVNQVYPQEQCRSAPSDINTP